MHYHFVDDARVRPLVAGGRVARVGRRARPPPATAPRAGRWSEALARGPDGLLEIDLQGARQVRETMPDALFVFLAPPELGRAGRRLVGRGTEDEEERERRLATARSSWRPRRSST